MTKKTLESLFHPYILSLLCWMGQDNPPSFNQINSPKSTKHNVHQINMVVLVVKISAQPSHAKSVVNTDVRIKDNYLRSIRLLGVDQTQDSGKFPILYPPYILYEPGLSASLTGSWGGRGGLLN
tara:strand:- start:842 stop:1213 length:372 start_codon:yes stop_codon:yes gene_type:complete